MRFLYIGNLSFSYRLMSKIVFEEVTEREEKGKSLRSNTGTLKMKSVHP